MTPTANIEGCLQISDRVFRSLCALICSIKGYIESLNTVNMSGIDDGGTEQMFI
jgi:hypothetical protein